MQHVHATPAVVVYVLCVHVHKDSFSVDLYRTGDRVHVLALKGEYDIFAVFPGLWLTLQTKGMPLSGSTTVHF